MIFTHFYFSQKFDYLDSNIDTIRLTLIIFNVFNVSLINFTYYFLYKTWKSYNFIFSLMKVGKV